MKKLLIIALLFTFQAQSFSQSILPTPYAINKVYDVDAKKLITNAGITDSVQMFAINELCVSYKLFGLWDKRKLIAPLAGGNASSHAYNLKNASADLVFNGGLTHNSNGISGNQVDGYIDLGYKPSDFGQNNFSMSLYNKNENAVNAFIGSTTFQTGLFADDQIYYSVNETGHASIPNLPGVGSIGFFDVTRDSENSTSISKNGVQVGAGSGTSVNPSDLNIFALAGNNEGSPTYFSNAVVSFISLGDALTIAEKRIEWIIVQQFEINMGRNF